MVNIDRILQKLEPLIPEQVKHWHKILDIGLPELKHLVEQQIISTAYQRLGNFRKEILLSLPPSNKAGGLFNLGTILYKGEKWPAGLSKSEILQNISIFGRSGAGKTNVAFHLMKQFAEHKIPFVFLDWKRTARHLLPGFKNKVNVYTPGRKLANFQFNPFISPPGLEYNVYINQLVDVLADAYTLGDGSKSILQKAISKCYEQENPSPDIKDIICQIEKMPDKGRIGSWKISALRALESLDFADISSTNKTSQQQMAFSLLEENTIIELDALGQNAKKFLIPILCLWFYYVKLSSPIREELDFVIFLEEAHHIMHKQEKSGQENLLEMLLRQCREIGIAMVIVDQHPHLISSAVLGNCYTSICLNQKNPADINKAAALSLVDNDEKHYFSMLPVGQGIIKLQDKWHKPFLVQFPMIRVSKGSVSDKDISGYVRANQTGSGRKTHQALKFGQVPRVHLYDMVLNDAELAFMEDVLVYKHDGVKQRYRRLGLAVGTGNRLKEQLITRGWLESDIIKTGKTRKVILRLSIEAKKALGFENQNPQHGSIAHEYWKNFYGKKFQDLGYKVSFECPRKSGRVDVAAVKGDEKIAIEIETGKSDFVRNVKQDLLAKFTKIIVIATDEKALDKIERLLAKEGLIIQDKISIVLGNGTN